MALFSLLLPFAALPARAQVRHGRESAQAKRPAEFINAYARDLTRGAGAAEAASADEPVPVRRAAEALTRGGRSGVALVGDDSVVIRAAVESFARRVAAGDVPASLSNRRVYAIDVRDLAPASKAAGEFGRRFAGVLAEVESAGEAAVLFVAGFDALLSARNDESRAALDALAAVLKRGRARVVCEVSAAGFELYLSQDAVIRPLVKVVRVGAAEETAEEEEDEAEEGSATAGGFVGDKLSSDLRELMASASGAERVRLILQGDDLRNEELSKYLEASGAQAVGSYATLGARAVELPVGAVGRLATRQGVGYVSLDRETSALGRGHVSKTTGTDDIDEVSEVSATGVTTTRTVGGKGVGIAILDSGVYAAHRAFLDGDGRSRVVFSKDFTGEGRTDDPFGHGTHVAALAAGNGRIADGMYAGVAPEASIINLRVLDSKGTGTTSRLLNALNWVYNNRAAYKIRVVNLSLGTAAIDSYRNDPVCRAVRKLVDAGVVVAAAAGNEGKDASGRKLYGRIHAPGNEPSAITVGATNTYGTNARGDDTVATYSSRGPTRSYWTDALGVRHYDNLVKPDLAAPGNKIISAGAPNNALVRMNPSLDSNVSASPDAEMMSLSGTSMATPLAAGAAALLLQINPKLTPNMIKALMMYTAQQLRGFNAFEQGAGQLNVSGAAALARAVRTDLSASTPLGTPIFTKMPPAQRTTIAGHTFVWSRGIILNHSFATGNALSLYQRVYGLGVLLSDGVTISEGALIADRTMMTQGITISESILTSSGSIMSDGVPFCGAGALLGDGLVLADRTVFGDGIILADGAILADGTVFSDGTIFADGARTLRSLLYGDPTSGMAAVPDLGR